MPRAVLSRGRPLVLFSLSRAGLLPPPGEAALLRAVPRGIRRGGGHSARHAGEFVRAGQSAAVKTGKIFGGIAEGVEVEVLAVAAPSAHADAVRLVQFAVIAAVIAREEAFLNALEREVKAPVLTVDGNPNVACERGGHGKARHHFIGQVILHEGIVLDVVVEHELVQPVIGARAGKMVELDFEAVPVVAEGGNAGERSVALCAYGDVAERFTVDNEVAEHILLVCGAFDEVCPVRLAHPNVDRVDVGVVKQLVLVTHCGGRAFALQRACAHEQRREREGKRHDDAAQGCCQFVLGHAQSLLYP